MSGTRRRSGSRRGIVSGRVAIVAPWISLVLIVGLGWAFPTRVVIDEGADLRMKEVAQAIEDVPRFIGEWTGIDENVPPEAQKLLRPNATLSRIYRRLHGPDLQVLVVHCGDARDMIGHYPPICYPSAGWVGAAIQAQRDITLNVGELDVPVSVYRFERTRDAGRQSRIRIFNAFILPDGTITRRIEDINKQSERRAVSALGVAQLQVITDASLERADAVVAAEEVLAGMSDLLEALRVTEGEAGER